MKLLLQSRNGIKQVNEMHSHSSWNLCHCLLQETVCAPYLLLLAQKNGSRKPSLSVSQRGEQLEDVRCISLCICVLVLLLSLQRGLSQISPKSVLRTESF